MPKNVDREGRRREIAEALHRIAAREGLEGVSVRTVAAEAGLSAGAVQREFDSKDRLLRFALRATVDEVTERFGRLRIGPGGLDFSAALRQVLLELLPTDGRKLAQARIWSAYYARAAVDPVFADTLEALTEETRASFLRLLEYARSQGALAPGTDLEAATEMLLVIIDGLWIGCARLPEAASLDGHRAAVEATVELLGQPTPEGPRRNEDPRSRNAQIIRNTPAQNEPTHG
ncbi:TetR/AcrR family transcriptional regulator [Nocardiopsis sp. NPDC058789]|uniref:TetR family transcriptional regulator C-terminal domain-containing protein n=1 Tax=Nocardiopsis eucommiae TaxID=2831970 RepID=A0A975QLF6_9ACTN|nr:TetR family transcriptional regulator C-terminal domain-containing protein [Nocardiopsis eucommiae]